MASWEPDISETTASQSSVLTEPGGDSSSPTRAERSTFPSGSVSTEVLSGRDVDAANLPRDSQLAAQGRERRRQPPLSRPESAAIPKQPRKRATGKNWKRLRALKMGACRGCGSPGESLHHLVPRSLGGDDMAANLIPLCGAGTTGCHGALENHTRGWEAIAANVRESLTPVELAYCFAKKGAYFLDRYLPERKAAA